MLSHFKNFVVYIVYDPERSWSEGFLLSGKFPLDIRLEPPILLEAFWGGSTGMGKVSRVKALPKYILKLSHVEFSLTCIPFECTRTGCAFFVDELIIFQDLFASEAKILHRSFSKQFFFFTFFISRLNYYVFPKGWPRGITINFFGRLEEYFSCEIFVSCEQWTMVIMK